MYANLFKAAFKFQSLSAASQTAAGPPRIRGAAEKRFAQSMQIKRTITLAKALQTFPHFQQCTDKQQLIIFALNL